MNKKLKYGVTLIILTSIVTNQNIDAAYFWQRLKDIYNYRPYSAIASLGLGGYAFTTENTKHKILAGLLSVMLLKRACNVADTSTLEGLIEENTKTFSPYNLALSSREPGNAKGRLIKDLKNGAAGNNDLLNKIDRLEKAIDKRFEETNPHPQLTPGSYGYNWKFGAFTRGNPSKEDYNKRLEILHDFFDEPSKTEQKINEALASPEPSKEVTQRQRDLSQEEY